MIVFFSILFLSVLLFWFFCISFGVQIKRATVLVVSISILVGLMYWAVGDRKVHKHITQQAKVSKVISDSTQLSQLEKNKVHDELWPDIFRHLQIKLQREPENIELWALLANQLGQMQQWPLAIEAARKATRLAPGRQGHHVYLAQLLVYQNNGKLTDESQAILERILEHNPDHQGATMLLAMAAFGSEQYSLAIQHWQSLLKTRANGSQGAKLIQSSIDEAKRLRKLKQESSDGIKIIISLNQRAKIKDLSKYKYLFVFAKDSSRAGPPVAVKRIPFKSFPVEIELSDSDSMLEAQKLSDLDSVSIFARLSAHSNVMKKDGVLEGSQHVVNLSETASVAIQLSALVQ